MPIGSSSHWSHHDLLSQAHGSVFILANIPTKFWRMEHKSLYFHWRWVYKENKKNDINSFAVWIKVEGPQYDRNFDFIYLECNNWYSFWFLDLLQLSLVFLWITSYRLRAAVQLDNTMEDRNRGSDWAGTYRTKKIKTRTAWVQ